MQSVILIFHDAGLDFDIHGKLVPHHCPVRYRAAIPLLVIYILLPSYIILPYLFPYTLDNRRTAYIDQTLLHIHDCVASSK